MRLRLSSPPRLRGSLLFALLWAVTAAPNAFGVAAATLIVTNTADNGAGSLRGMITMATGGDTIQFDPALNGQTITLTSDELVVDKDITITGPGPDSLTVAKTPSQPPYFRIFNIPAGRTVVIAGLTISGG